MASRALRSAVCLAVIGLAACSGSSRTLQDYERKAANTAEATASAVETARLAAEAAGRRRALAPYLSVVLTDVERDASDIEDTFLSVQPPDDRADQLRDELEAMLEDAGSTLAELRVAARRGELSDLPEIAEDLDQVSDRLQAFEEEHS